jgi:hypothetical protein
MVLENITAQQYATSISDAISERDDSLDTRIGPIANLYVTPVARVLERQNNRAVYISQLASLQYVDKVRIEDLDELVYNEGIVRWSGSRAVTTVTFSRAQPPTSDITVPVNLPVATPTDPSTGLAIVFRTIEAKTMYAAAASSYYNATTEKYELKVAVSSVSTGDDVDVGARSITVMRRPISGFDSIFNEYATSSGKGLETNAELATRYLLHVQGSQLSTPLGIKSSLLDNFSSVEDVYVVFGNNAYLEREQEDAGAVDIWVKGESSLETTYIVVYPGIDILIPLDRQPVIEVTDIFDGVTHFVEGTDYEVVLGDGIYGYSNWGSDGIKFIAGGSSPTMGVSLTITYKYNSLINTLASYYNQPQYNYIGASKLFRWAQPLLLTIDVSLTTNAGNPDTVATNVRNTIATYINNLKLGINVEEFDLDREVGRLYGVDNLVWNQLSVVGGSGVADIDVGPMEYAYIEIGSLNVTLT